MVGFDAPSGEAAVIRNELSAVRRAAERSAADRADLVRRQDALAGRLEKLRAEMETSSVAQQEADDAQAGLAEALRAAESDLAGSEAELQRCESLQREAEANHSGWQARAEALLQALQDAHQRAGTERLEGLEGVLGTLVDLVEVDPGYQEAFEAAAAEALGAVLVADTAAARRAITSLVQGDHSGAVLALDAISNLAAPTSAVPVLPGEPVRGHVRCASKVDERSVEDRRGLERLLDTMFANVTMASGGWQQAAELSTSHPEAVVVTPEGHRFSVTGWRLDAAGSGATGAALEEATEAASRSSAAAEATQGATKAAREALVGARRAHAEALRERDANDAMLTRSSDAMVRLRSDSADVEAEVASIETALIEVDQRRASEAARLAELESALPLMEAEEAEAAERARLMAEAQAALDASAAEIRSRRTDSEVRDAAVLERRRYVAERLEHLDGRLAGLATEAAEAAQRRILLEAQSKAVGRLKDFVERRMMTVDAMLSERREERRAQSEVARAASSRLEELRVQRAAQESELEENRALLGKAEVSDAETRTRLDAAMLNLRTELDVEPEVAEATECPLLPEGVGASARARELQRELRAMGPINPLALKEYEELSQRHEFLEGQLHDVRQSRRELNKVIKAVDEEIVKVFASAFADVRENFEHLFQTLFPGGSGQPSAHRTLGPPQHGYRDRGEALGQEREEALPALGWRAFADCAGVPLRSVPLPSLTVLRDGRGRSGTG